MDTHNINQVISEYENKDRTEVRYVHGQPHLTNQFTHLAHWEKWGRLEKLSLDGKTYFHTGKTDIIGIDADGQGIHRLKAYTLKENRKLGHDEAVKVKNSQTLKSLTDLYDSRCESLRLDLNEQFESDFDEFNYD